MVLIDSNGVKINASVKKDLVNQFDSFLSQGSSKIIINFSLNPSCGSYRTTIHPYRIGFLSTTRVRNCDDLPDALTGFEPVNYRDIIDGTLNTDYLVDVIGQIVEVTPIEVVSANGKETHKLTVELRNEKDERLPMVLWGNFATDVSGAIQGRGENAIICVLRFGKIKVWTDERSVSNAYNVSDVELNPFTPEVEAFAALLPKDELALAIVEPKPLALTAGAGDKNDFLVNTPRKTISQSVKSNQVKNPKLMPRYKLHLVVVDNTGNSKFLLFDAIAMQILNRPCNELTGNSFEEGALTTLAIENSVISDAPEGSLMLNYQSSQECEVLKVTPAKRRGGTVISLEEHVEENSVTKYPSRARIKIEKADKSG
ncbi:hypothetical protein F2Q69_00020231 [Brassica cretica]|uniref:Replication protein A 70 kDa DNA-binding subunit B/D first OB fold domain-containing protein n=1 Tax=Brassica cretica TaxID=69181 RepID=A0A8S9QM33_BRACR|nr:hypothetical protein F2Q69_00020231 [Brassica cretica]